MGPPTQVHRIILAVFTKSSLHKGETRGTRVPFAGEVSICLLCCFEVTYIPTL